MNIDIDEEEVIALNFVYGYLESTDLPRKQWSVMGKYKSLLAKANKTVLKNE